MCYGYEEFCELEEIQELTDEYLKKAKDIFNERVKDHIEKYNAREKTLNNRETDLRKRESTLKEAEERFEKDKNGRIYQMMQQFGFDLKPNQKVYVIYNERKETKCPHCEKGKITKVVDGLEFKAECPHCKGFGYTSHYDYKIVCGEVNRVTFRIDWNMQEETLFEIKTWFSDDESRVRLKNCQPNLFNESWQEFARKDIYLTKEEAEKAIEEKKAQDAKR